MQMKQIDENIAAIRYNIGEAASKCGRNPDDIRIMAVTKTVSPDAVNYAVSCGITLLGENRVQEFLEKKDSYDKSAEVHFIGHLQTNKVKYIIDEVSMFQSVDSIKLALEISRYASVREKTADILCEVNIGSEDSKNGVMPELLPQLLSNISELPNLRLRGLMAIPPPFGGERFLQEMHELYLKMSETYPMDILSTGMSGDYTLAVKHGSNIVRIGSALFGQRKYL